MPRWTTLEPVLDNVSATRSRRVRESDGWVRRAHFGTTPIGRRRVEDGCDCAGREAPAVRRPHPPVGDVTDRANGDVGALVAAMDTLQPLDVNVVAIDSEDPQVGPLMPRLERRLGPKADPLRELRSIQVDARTTPKEPPWSPSPMASGLTTIPICRSAIRDGPRFCSISRNTSRPAPDRSTLSSQGVRPLRYRGRVPAPRHSATASKDRTESYWTRHLGFPWPGRVQPTQSPRQIAASRYVGCMAAVATSPIVAATMTHERKP